MRSVPQIKHVATLSVLSLFRHSFLLCSVPVCSVQLCSICLAPFRFAPLRFSEFPSNLSSSCAFLFRLPWLTVSGPGSDLQTFSSVRSGGSRHNAVVFGHALLCLHAAAASIEGSLGLGSRLSRQRAQHESCAPEHSSGSSRAGVPRPVHIGVLLIAAVVVRGA